MLLPITTHIALKDHSPSSLNAIGWLQRKNENFIKKFVGNNTSLVPGVDFKAVAKYTN